jgi:hypothetical protein
VYGDRYIDGDVPDTSKNSADTSKNSAAGAPTDANSSDDGHDDREDSRVNPAGGDDTGGGRSRSTGRDTLRERFRRMSAALCEVVDDYGLVSFHPMNVEDAEVSNRGHVVVCTVVL